MSVCTFFGHRECYGLDREVLCGAIEEAIHQGAEEFMVGHQGQFDRMVRSCLKSVQNRYPQIRYSVVLAYRPGEKREGVDLSDTIYPEGIEGVHPKFALEWRNRYMVAQSDICICYVNQTWGGAYKFARLARQKGMRMFNLGNAPL